MAGSTPVFGFPYPQASDLVANYPTLGQELAEDVETAILASGKIKQIVRATDSSERFTTSTSYVDVTGMSVTITPSKNTSTLLIVATGMGNLQWGNTPTTNVGFLRIADSSNTALSGAQEMEYGSKNMTGTGVRAFTTPFTLIGYVAPASTSALTYKLRFRSGDAEVTAVVANNASTGQLLAIEVLA